MAKQVDPFRYIDSMTRRVIEAWIKREPDHAIPWASLDQPLADSTVALVSSAALALADDEPFDQEGERQDPWWGDPSFRTVPATATEQEIRCYHLHINPKHVLSDLDCALPMRRLGELSDEGLVGAAAAEHYTMMGYILRPAELLERTVPKMIDALRAAKVDAVVLVPI
ncbi:MAG: hypothetical protein JRI23_28675 [Deltaproteobacteria bacterium]|jgi:D-proline reductase (dithiol) PrdB|nr:hypothetical protein [Deltaproteobacteria bacterium]MBW2536084.1 hypothetical protein [Deltaproteobacteria bacterium]